MTSVLLLEVIELRRYTIRPGQREHAQYFEIYFPEAFQQLGALAVDSSSSVTSRTSSCGCARSMRWIPQ